MAQAENIARQHCEKCPETRGCHVFTSQGSEDRSGHVKPTESRAYAPETQGSSGQNRPARECSSGVERPVHIGKVRGSRPCTPTIPPIKRRNLLLDARDPTNRERFWAKVLKGGPDECWPWTGARNPHGYGKLKIKRTRMVITAPRFAFAVHFDVDPGEQCVLHRCDNRACCNPNHLFLGSQLDNLADMRAKGRARHWGRDPFKGGR